MSKQRRLAFLSVALGSGLLYFNSAAGAVAEPLYPVSEDEVIEIPAGTSARIHRDWQEAPTQQSASRPDRGFSSVWVRLFPLISNPLGDPYPNTTDYARFSLANSSGIKVFVLDNETALDSGKTVELDFAAQTIAVDGRVHSMQAFWLTPQGSALTSLSWDHGSVRTQMRGGFVVKKSMHIPRDNPVARELWSVINVVGLDDYLRSVVPSEVLSSWNRETLRAQAIAARTYGLYEVAAARLQNQDFDVDPSTWYQSYQGAMFWDRTTGRWRTIELSATSDAVRATKGEVILHKNEVIKAYFSSNSGGQTCLVTECFEQETNPPYIASVADHPSIRKAPGGAWGSRANLAPEAIHTVLLNLGLAVPSSVKRLDALELGPSGRTWRLRVSFQNGENLDLDRLQTRKVMHLYGPIRSFLYQLGNFGKDGKQKILGHGYGHGVGLSQWGAQLFARQGWGAHRILQHYYNDVVIQNLGAPLL